MKKIAEFTPPPLIVFLMRILGLAAAITGLVTAVLAGFQPFYWFLIAMCFFFGVICSILFRIKAMIEKKVQN